MPRTRARRSTATAPKKPRGSEHLTQTQFFKMIDATGHPAARRTTACVNGAVGRSMRRISWFMAEGLRPGCPDILILHAARGYPFAAIEFKHGTNTITDNQRRFLQDVITAGGAAKVFYDAEAAFRFWAWYVGLVEDVTGA